MNLASVIMYLFPNANSTRDFIAQDNGQGQYVAQWHLAQPQPTQAELDAAWLPALRADKMQEFKAKAKAELDPTDYKVVRHRDQVAAGQPTTLTNAQYLQLLADRNAIRDKSNTLEQQVIAAQTEATILAVVW